MKITLTDGTQLPLTFDPNGSCYLEYEDNSYQFCVTGDNHPVLDPGDYTPIDSDEPSYLPDDINESFYETEYSGQDSFTFGQVNSVCLVDVIKRRNGDTPAMYETYIYQNNALCYKTTSTNEPLFQLSIDLSGKVGFKPTGGNYYECVITKTVDGELTLVDHQLQESYQYTP